MVFGCAVQTATPTPTPTPITRAAPTPLPPGAATTTAVATPTRVITPTPLPSPTPEAALPLRITALLDPPTPRAGAEFVLRLVIANDGGRQTRGVYIATTGPWDRWTILQIAPPSSFARDASGWRIIAPLQIPPHATGTVELSIRTDAPSEDQLTFAVREAEPGELR